MSKRPLRVYWANAMFSEADRAFNARCVARLRSLGYEVFLPQDSTTNQRASPEPGDIFFDDTAAILRSDVVVACLDQEGIDSGVACEVGVAFAWGVPVVGLLTDFRQYRVGASRIYKNPYVLGAIEANGMIVSSVDALEAAIEKAVLGAGGPEPAETRAALVRAHFDAVAQEYTSFVEELETWYTPPWTACDAVSEWVSRTSARRVLDFGCGPGRLGECLTRRHPHLWYLGYDPSPEMVAIARSRHASKACTFHEDLSVVQAEAAQAPFDLSCSLFGLHDAEDKAQVLMLLRETVGPSGHVGVVDLSVWDLPGLTGALRRGLARPVTSRDPRLSAAWVRGAARELGLQLVDMRYVTVAVSFPRPDDVERFLRVFGVCLGMDMPLGLRPVDCQKSLERARAVVQDLAFPFEDERVFLQCLWRKP